MILHALYDLYDRLQADPGYEVAPPGFSYQKVTFSVVLEPDGTFFGVQDVRLRVANRMRPRRVLVLGGTKPSGSGLNPCFLWDAPPYLLGWDPANPKRAFSTFAAFRDYHLKAEPAIGVREFSAVCRFLEGWRPEQAYELSILAEVGSGFGVFQIRGKPQLVHEHPVIQAWWKARNSATEPGPLGQCLVTGENAPIARLHTPRIKGVAGSQPSGATIAGFNDPAYWSYGHTQSFNAPVSETAAHRYTTALNALLDGPKRDKHRLVVGSTTVVFWTDPPTPTEDIFLPFAAEGSAALSALSPQDEITRRKLEAFLTALRSGVEAYQELETNPHRTNFFILGLSAPTPARVAVRFFHRATLAQLLHNLRRHHQDIGIQRRYAETNERSEPEFPSNRFLLRESVKDEKDVPQFLAAKLFESVVSGRDYPVGLVQAVMRRIVADRIVNYARACIIKGYLVRNLGKEAPVALDPSRPEPAYRLGRLFAALEKTQQDALPGIKKTIRDSFYSAASATPEKVFPRLLRNYQYHLTHLEPGPRISRERLVQEILAPLRSIPAHLDLGEQGLFTLGYYHQMNDFFTKKSKQEQESQEL